VGTPRADVGGDELKDGRGMDSKCKAKRTEQQQPRERKWMEAGGRMVVRVRERPDAGRGRTGDPAGAAVFALVHLEQASTRRLAPPKTRSFFGQANPGRGWFSIAWRGEVLCWFSATTAPRRPGVRLDLKEGGPPSEAVVYRKRGLARAKRRPARDAGLPILRPGPGKPRRRAGQGAPPVNFYRAKVTGHQRAGAQP